MGLHLVTASKEPAGAGDAVDDRFFDITVAPAVKERRLLWTTHDNLYMWFLGFKDFLLKFGFATLNGTGELIFSPEMRSRPINVDETKASFDGSNT